MRFGNPRGFTLIEMLVVLSLLGVFLAMVSHNNSRIIDRSRDIALSQDIHHIRTAIHQYLLDHQNTFPPDLKALKPYLGRSFDTWRGSRATGHFHYDSEAGAVFLADTGGSRSIVTDVKGIPYGEY
jgi:general secretion pathway protein G